MPRLKVHSLAQSVKNADAVWHVVQDFCAPWHPAIAGMTPESTAQGNLIRRFTVKDDDSVYRERLTYYSDTERTYAYTHLEGIEGVTSYDARLSVVETKSGSTVTMSSELTAPTGRAAEIARGTKEIFDDGTSIIAECASLEPAITPAKLHPADITTQFIDSLPKLALSVAGQKTKTLCLFLHGIGGNRTNWHDQLSAAAPYCQAASLDLRGYGQSTLGADQSTIDGYCEDILRIMDVMDVDQLILCGLSYGAWIATSFAMRHPDKLAALVVSGGCTGMSEAGADERDAFRLSREVPMSEGQTPADFAPSVVEVIAGPSASDKDRAALRESMETIPTTTYADALRCFTNPLERFDFAKLDMPVLLMTGEFDKLATPLEIKNVAERIFDASARPDVRFEVIKGAGHVCNLERPDSYNHYLTDFIARVLP